MLQNVKSEKKRYRYISNTASLQEIDVALFMADNRISSLIASVTQLRPEIYRPIGLIL